jgi:hypothetical protein
MRIPGYDSSLFRVQTVKKKGPFREEKDPHIKTKVLSHA